MIDLGIFFPKVFVFIKLHTKKDLEMYWSNDPLTPSKKGKNPLENQIYTEIPTNFCF